MLTLQSQFADLLGEIAPSSLSSSDATSSTPPPSSLKRLRRLGRRSETSSGEEPLLEELFPMFWIQEHVAG